MHVALASRVLNDCLLVVFTEKSQVSCSGAHRIDYFTVASRIQKVALSRCSGGLRMLLYNSERTLVNCQVYMTV